MSISLSIIIPVYNEGEVIGETYRRLTDVMRETNGKYELIFVNDGSIDNSLTIIKKIIAGDDNVRLIDFSRNFGHQIAISAGVDNAQGDAIVVIDADLQDPPEVILQMIEKWKQGYEVVYGKRIKREGETLLKKTAAKLYYRLLKGMTNVDIPVDTGDFRLIDKKVRDVFSQFTEKNRYVRGLISWAGFRQTAVEYVRQERYAGSTKYSFKNMVKFALDGITSFSGKPLKLAIYVGAFVSFLSIIFIIAFAFSDFAVMGGAFAAAISIFFNGITILFLGVIGEYIGRIYDEAKNRPLYVIREKVGFENKTKDI